VTGPNSVYRDPSKVKELYGFLPERTVNPRPTTPTRATSNRVQKEAVARA